MAGHDGTGPLGQGGGTGRGMGPCGGAEQVRDGSDQGYGPGRCRGNGWAGPARGRGRCGGLRQAAGPGGEAGGQERGRRGNGKGRFGQGQGRGRRASS